MIRALLVGAVLSLAGVAAAEPVAILAHPSETIKVPAKAAHLTVFFDTDSAHYQVTMVFNDHSGDVLRSRVKLADNQTHTVIYRDEDSDLRTEFMVERVGRYVGVHVIELPSDERVAVQDQERTKVK